MKLDRIERRRAVDAVHQALREAILDRRFPAGSRLNVDQLAGQLGVSLTPIRNAVQLLETEGLVEVRPRSGTFVATLTRRALEEVFDLRRALECLAAENAGQLSDQNLERARELVAILARPVRGASQRRSHEQANSEFHDLIVRSAGNDMLAEMYEGLRAHITMYRVHRHDDRWQLRLPQEQREHEEILQAMERRDPKSLSEALRKHISRAKEALAESLPEAR